MPVSGVVHPIDDAIGRSHAFSITPAGFAVLAYGSGTAFLDALLALQTGCILTDIRMYSEYLHKL